MPITKRSGLLALLLAALSPPLAPMPPCVAFAMPTMQTTTPTTAAGPRAPPPETDAAVQRVGWQDDVRRLWPLLLGLPVVGYIGGRVHERLRSNSRASNAPQSLQPPQMPQAALKGDALHQPDNLREGIDDLYRTAMLRLEDLLRRSKTFRDCFFTEVDVRHTKKDRPASGYLVNRAIDKCARGAGLSLRHFQFFPATWDFNIDELRARTTPSSPDGIDLAPATDPVTGHSDATDALHPEQQKQEPPQQFSVADGILHSVRGAQKDRGMMMMMQRLFSHGARRTASNRLAVAGTRGTATGIPFALPDIKRP